MSRSWARNFLYAFAAAVAFSLLALPQVALAGNGNGTGGGGGQSVPTLVSSTPADGSAVDAASAETIALEFTNNVADASHSADNIALVHLQTESGEQVAATVTAADTQVEPDKRNYLYLQPASTLVPGSYVVVIDPGITSKNGVTNEEGAKVGFTVKDDSAAAQSSLSSSSASDSSSSSATSSQASASNAEQAPFFTATVAAVAAIIVVVLVIALIMRNRSKKH